MIPTRSMLAAALVTALAAPFAQGNADVAITVWIDAVPTGGSALADRCTVNVPAGADGFAVLEAARVAGCADGYTFVGGFLDCVDGAGAKPNLCTACPPPYLACAYWALWVDGKYADEGLAGFSAGENRDLGVAFELWPATMIPAP